LNFNSLRPKLAVQAAHTLEQLLVEDERLDAQTSISLLPNSPEKEYTPGWRQPVQPRQGHVLQQFRLAVTTRA